jgi:hypothetical protein
MGIGRTIALAKSNCSVLGLRMLMDMLRRGPSATTIALLYSAVLLLAVLVVISGLPTAGPQPKAVDYRSLPEYKEMLLQHDRVTQQREQAVKEELARLYEEATRNGKHQQKLFWMSQRAALDVRTPLWEPKTEWEKWFPGVDFPERLNRILQQYEKRYYDASAKLQDDYEELATDLVRRGRTKDADALKAEAKHRWGLVDLRPQPPGEESKVNRLPSDTKYFEYLCPKCKLRDETDFVYPYHTIFVYRHLVHCPKCRCPMGEVVQGQPIDPQLDKGEWADGRDEKRAHERQKSHRLVFEPGDPNSPLAPDPWPMSTEIDLVPTELAGIDGQGHLVARIPLGLKPLCEQGQLIVIGRTKANSPYDLLFIDTDLDGEVADERLFRTTPLIFRSHWLSSFEVDLKAVHKEDSGGALAYPVLLRVTGNTPDEKPSSIHYTRRCFSLANATIDDIEYRVVVIDGNNDGFINDGDYWRIIRIDAGDRHEDWVRTPDYLCWENRRAWQLVMEGTDGRVGTLYQFDPVKIETPDENKTLLDGLLAKHQKEEQQKEDVLELERLKMDWLPPVVVQPDEHVKYPVTSPPKRIPQRARNEKAINRSADRANAIRWPLNGHQYKFFKESLAWETAKKFCEDKGGHLLMLETRAEHEFVTDAFQRAFAANKDQFGDGVSCWMGATEVQVGGQSQWRWLGANEVMGFTKWRGHHPNRVEKDRDYMTLSIAKGDWVNFWGDQHPDVFIICEWDK